MDSEQAKWSPDQPKSRPRSFTMIDEDLEAFITQITKPETQDASMQTGESSAPKKTTQEGLLAGDPTEKQVTSQGASADVPQDTGVQSVDQVMQEHPSESQDRASDNEMLVDTEEDIGAGMPQSRDERDLAPSQEPTEGPHVAQIPQESEMMDNEKNARLEAQMERSP